MVAQNLTPVKQIELDWSDCSLAQILEDVMGRGLDPQNLIELSVIEYTDEYRSYDYLIREIAKLDAWQKNPPAPKKKRNRTRLHKTPGRTAAQISADMIFSEEVDNV